MSETVLKIEGLSKDYKMFARKKDRIIETLFPGVERHGVFEAMHDFNLEVKKGEVLGVLGKNGAGKSTLLKMITGVVTPTKGTIEAKGKISSLLELGTAFNQELTGYENIYQHGQVMGLTNEEIKAREQEIIDFADIGDHLYQPVKTYSSGMFARLAFACAINVNPDILIVDEVLSVGDMSFQLKCFKKFEQFKESGKTILFVTHSITDILRNCTRTIIIDAGRKIFDGDVKEGVEKYKKIIVGLDDKTSKEGILTDKQILEKNPNYQASKEKNGETWKSHFNENPNLITYGDGSAEVIDYGMFDENGNYISVLENDKEVVLKSKIVFHKDVKDPIFTMTVKDFKGLEMAGTNTLIEKVVTGNYKKGDMVVAEFRQVINVAPGKYTLSFSCTHFNSKGELEVLNRKYDALLIEVLSTKDTVGLMRLDSKIKIEIILVGILEVWKLNLKTTTLEQLKNSGHSQMMGYIIKTDNDKIIVIDGGTSDDTENLLQKINEYTGKVDYWFITHPHQDHATAFIDIVNNYNIDIGKVYVTTEDEEWYNNYGAGRADECIRFLDTIKSEKISSKVEEVTLNEQIQIDNIKCEILGIKNPEITENAINNSSMVIKMETKKNSILFLGDTGVESGNKLLDNQKEKLKVNILQMAHHGQQGVSKEIYEYIKPKICLWPTPDWLWINDSGNGEDSGPWKTKETRKWIEELNVNKNIIEKDGNIKISI